MEVSGKKNILLIIDDADRVGREEEVAQLLSEVSGVNGIISIMLLNKSIRGLIRPNLQSDNVQISENNDINEEVINKYGKYIHLEIPVGEIEKIEYEKIIKEQIVSANDNVKKDDIYYVSYISNTEKRSIFDSISDFGTNRLAIEGHIVYGEYNLLTELFNAELKESNDSFGRFLEKKVKEFFISCKEFEQFTKQENNEFMQVTCLFFLNEMFGIDSFFDWVGQIEGTFNQFFGEFIMVMESIKMIEQCPENNRPNISKLDDIKTYFMKSTFLNAGFDGSMDNGLNNDYNFIIFKSLLFSRKDEIDIIDLLNNGNFIRLNALLAKKTEKIVNLNLLGITILEFMSYVRKTMSNYRFFKMQIRESNLLNTFYLDYLLKDWHVDNAKKEEFNSMKNQYVWMQNTNLDWPYLQAFFNTIMYEKFVNSNGKCFEERQLSAIKALLLRSSNRNILILTGKDSENKIFYNAVLIAENKKCYLDDSEKDLLKSKIRKIYHEYRNEEVALELTEL